MGTNGKLLQWQEIKPGFMAASGAHIAILFDTSGRMVRMTHRYQSK